MQIYFNMRVLIDTLIPAETNRVVSEETVHMDKRIGASETLHKKVAEILQKRQDSNDNDAGS